MQTIFKNVEMVSHFNLANCGIRIDKSEIKAPLHILNGKMLVMETVTRKTQTGYGKAKRYFYLHSSETKKKATPMFGSIDDFCKYYNLP